MKRIFIISIVLLPVLGLAIGYLFAHLVYIGFLVPWQKLNPPGEAIAKIISVRDERTLLVATESGQVLSLAFEPPAGSSTRPALAWREEPANAALQPSANFRYYGAEFTPFPHFFKVEKLFKQDYLYHIEGKGEVRLAQAADGSYWFWQHAIGGMTGMIYFFYPAFGTIAGLLIVLAVLVARWLWRRAKQPKPVPPVAGE